MFKACGLVQSHPSHRPSAGTADNKCMIILIFIEFYVNFPLDCIDCETYVDWVIFVLAYKGSLL